MNKHIKHHIINKWCDVASVFAMLSVTVNIGYGSYKMLIGPGTRVNVQHREFNKKKKK